MVSKQSILGYKRTKPLESINVPEWGGKVYIRVMSSNERDAYEAETVQVNGKNVTLNRQGARARLLVKVVCDESGHRLFEDRDAKMLGEQPADLIEPVVEFASRVNKLSKEDIDDLAKNSDTAPNADSGTNSPAI